MQVKDYHGKNVIDSREVAEMVEKKHKNLLRDIAGYIKIMEESGELKIEPSDFFIPSTYMSEQNKEMPCYLVTRKGCDMIANKLTGEKGVLFTAAYVIAFERMEKGLASCPLRIPQVSPSGLARLMEVHRQAIVDAGGTPGDVVTMIAELDQTWGVPIPSPLSKQLPGQISLWDKPSLKDGR